MYSSIPRASAITTTPAIATPATAPDGSDFVVSDEGLFVAGAADVVDVVDVDYDKAGCQYRHI